MNEHQIPSGKPPDPDRNPGSTHVEEFHEPSTMGLKLAVVLFVVMAGITAGYGWLQHDAAQQLASQRAELQTSLAQAKSQENALTAKVNALNVALAQEEAARAQTEAMKNEQFPPRTRAVRPRITNQAVARPAPADDPRWKQVQEQLGDQQRELANSQKQIAETQANLDQAKSELEGNLQSARTELGSDIARNHAELVTLEKKGERNYYEFSFEKSKTYHHAGPISIALRKADPKHESCDLQMLVDDREITRKHVNLYESMAFYPQGYTLPLELVINHIDNDSVQGYVSEPKYRSPQQAAAPAPPATAASVNPPIPAAQDPKLEHRQDGPH
jgi:outer membrane murein-binding lipoprotein Lpp